MIRQGIFFILAWTVLIAGCGSSEETSFRQPSIEGLTLADLQSTVAESPPPVLMFMVAAYLVDAEQLEAVRGCFDSLPQSPIRFRDKKAFEANGLLASHGTGMAMGPVSDCLVRMGAKQDGHISLVLNAGMESPFSSIYVDGETVTYLSAEGDRRTVSLHNGVLGWTLTAQPDATVPRRVQVTIEPVFSPQGIMNWPGAERLTQKLGYRFEDLGFEVLLREADFVMLSVNRDSVDEMTTLERLLFMSPARPDKVRLYAIICAQVQR